MMDKSIVNSKILVTVQEHPILSHFGVYAYLAFSNSTSAESALRSAYRSKAQVSEERDSE